MKVSVKRDFIRDFGDTGYAATSKSEQFANLSAKKAHHSSNYDYKGDYKKQTEQDLDFYPTRKYDIKVYTSKGTHPCGEDFESGFKKTTKYTSDVTYTSWTEDAGRSETISTHGISESDYTEYTYATTGTGNTLYNDPYETDSDKNERNEGWTFKRNATSSINRQGTSFTLEVESRGINNDPPDTNEKETIKGYLSTKCITMDNGGITEKRTHESPEYYSSKYQAIDTSYTSSYWDSEATTTKKSNYTLMEVGNLPVTTLSCVPFNQFTTSSKSTTKSVDNDTESVSYVATTISRITKEVITLGTETDSVWTFWKHGKSSYLNDAFVKEFTLEEDNPFMSFLCLETRGFESLRFDPFRSVTANVTLTPKVRGAWSANKYAVVKFGDSTNYYNDYSVNGSTSYIENKVTTWKVGDTPRSAYHPLCGIRDGTNVVIDERDDKTTFKTMLQHNAQTTVIYTAEIPFLDKLEPADFTKTVVQIDPDTSTTMIDGYQATIDYETSMGSVRYAGLTTTGVDTDLESTDEDYFLTESSPTFYVNSPEGRVVKAGYDTYSIEISVKQTSSTKYTYKVLPYIDIPQTYEAVQLIGYNISSPDCLNGDEELIISKETNTDPLEESDYEVSSTTAEVVTDVCETWENFQKAQKDRDATNPAYINSNGTAGRVTYAYQPETRINKKTTMGKCDAYVYAKTERITGLKNTQTPYTMKFALGSGISSSSVYTSGLVQSETENKTVVTNIQYAGFDSLAFGFSSERDYKTTLTGLTTVVETSTKFSNSQNTSTTDKVFFSINSCGYRFPVPEGTTRTFTGVAWTFQPDPTVYSMYQKTENLGEGGVTVNNYDKFMYHYEIPENDTFDVNDLYIRLAKQCALEIHEPYVILKNHWQPFTSKGTNGDFFFSFKESNYQPVVKGGANYGGGVDHLSQSHSDFVYDSDVTFAGGYRGMNQAWVPDVDMGYVISSSARSYTKYYYSDGDWDVTTSTYIQQGSGSMPTVLTFSDNDLDQINMFGATRYGLGKNTDSETFLYSVEFDKFSETNSSSKTYESTTSFRDNGVRVTESTTATLYSVRWESAEFYKKETFNSDYVKEIKTEFVEFGFRTVGPLAYYPYYSQYLVYSNSYDYPIDDGGFPWERPYLIGGMYFNGSPKSATIISPFSNAAVEMYETVNKNGKLETFSNIRNFKFSMSTEGTNRTIVQPAQCINMQIKDDVKLEKCKPMKPVYYGGGARVGNMIDDFNAKLIFVPQQNAFTKGSPLTVGHNPIYREYGTVEESVGENCPEEDD